MSRVLNNEIFTGKICPYCNRQTEFVDSKEVYASGVSYGMLYICRRCDAWVGVHKGTDKALGRLADRELREWKIEAHSWFDIIWKKKMQGKVSMREARSTAYKWLAREMGLNPAHCHIGMFDVNQCKEVVNCCKAFYRNNTI